MGLGGQKYSCFNIPQDAVLQAQRCKRQSPPSIPMPPMPLFAGTLSCLRAEVSRISSGGFVLSTDLKDGLQLTRVLPSGTIMWEDLMFCLPDGPFCFHVGTSLSPVYVKVTYSSLSICCPSFGFTLETVSYHLLRLCMTGILPMGFLYVHEAHVPGCLCI